MSLTNVTSRLSPGELAREPRHLGVVAYFDGYMQAAYGARPRPMPRRLAPSEARSWRDGWNQGFRERRCHAAHGFAPCTEEAHA